MDIRIYGTVIYPLINYSVEDSRSFSHLDSQSASESIIDAVHRLLLTSIRSVSLNSGDTNVVSMVDRGESYRSNPILVLSPVVLKPT